MKLLPIVALAAAWTALAADQPTCSRTTLCATGCCSKFGFCGVGDDFCGDGCQSTCDYKAPPTDCGPGRPCADGSCCSKFGFCGLGKKYCAPDVCISRCNVKADCDPGGYGKDYVKSSDCPLHVCCSKWGYCGIDAEHCQGKPPPTRPSCSKTGSINKVVGYYEGWASRRPCDKFAPEDIPTGVYSHLNFAFASIDPVTFKIVPAHPGDIELYRRLTDLKRKDPSLKVFIAIGGWAFNDPGSTEHVFSQLAASPIRQLVFFRSLISFMSTYGFDGVDLDWEYPAADDRAGKEEDFQNYPTFVERLRDVLATTGAGLTITLPVSYWYLRHFDIARLEHSVDWFNMMSYDLHGAWDKPNKWVGNFLNSHTNLTEIEEYFDLLWRNDIHPGKVVMGLGFYSRTFEASDPSCMHAGCRFNTVGDRGACTHEYGVLSNAEISRMVTESGATPELDKDAAVKLFVHGSSWITYDDEDTFKLKANFARSQCLGGVMVWAVSLDRKDGTYSLALQQATGFQSSGVIAGDGTGVAGGGRAVSHNPSVTRGQCFWTECAQTCPNNYVPMTRYGPGTRSGELMLDSSGCRKDGGVRTLCCPTPNNHGELPTCGWYDFNNGQCGQKLKGTCPDGYTEVGSTSVACGWGGYQIACCEISLKDSSSLTDLITIDSTVLYSQCNWPTAGSSNCGDARGQNGCDKNGININELFNNYGGSGGHLCTTFDSFVGERETLHGSYCCFQPKPAKRWSDCSDEEPIKASDGYCAGQCPYGKTRVGSDDFGRILGYQRWGCKSGTGNECCRGDYKTGASNKEIGSFFADALKVVLDNGCPIVKDLASRTVSQREGGRSSQYCRGL